MPGDPARTVEHQQSLDATACWRPSAPGPGQLAVLAQVACPHVQTHTQTNLMPQAPTLAASSAMTMRRGQSSAFVSAGLLRASLSKSAGQGKRAEAAGQVRRLCKQGGRLQRQLHTTAATQHGPGSHPSRPWLLRRPPTVQRAARAVLCRAGAGGARCGARSALALGSSAVPASRAGVAGAQCCTPGTACRAARRAQPPLDQASARCPLPCPHR